MESTFMRMPTIHSYMYTVIAATQLQLLHYLSTALLTSVTGCPLIDWSLMQTRQSCCGPVQQLCCGPVQSTICHYLMVAVQVCVLEKILSLPASTSVFSVSPSRLTSVWISMSAMFVQRIFQTSTTLSYSEVTWFWLGCDTCPCLRVIPRGLLQCNLRWGAEECNRQATTSAEHGRTHCQWHTEIRSRSDGSHAQWASLAWRSGSS